MPGAKTVWCECASSLLHRQTHTHILMNGVHLHTHTQAGRTNREHSHASPLAGTKSCMGSVASCHFSCPLLLWMSILNPLTQSFYDATQYFTFQMIHRVMIAVAQSFEISFHTFFFSLLTFWKNSDEGLRENGKKEIYFVNKFPPVKLLTKCSNLEFNADNLLLFYRLIEKEATYCTRTH